MNYKTLFISILISLFFIGCEKDEETFIYEGIDLIELSTIYGMTREEINDKFSGALINQQDKYPLNEEYLIKTKVGNYNLYLAYNHIINENTEYIEAVHSIGGAISENSRTNSINKFKNLIKSNFNNYPDQTFVDLEFGYGGAIRGTEVTLESFQDIYDNISESQNTYRLIWIDGKITFSLCLLEESIWFTIESEDYKL